MKRQKLIALLCALVLLLTSCSRPYVSPLRPGGALSPSSSSDYPAPDPKRGTISYSQMVAEYRRPDVDEMEKTARELEKTVNSKRANAALKALRVFEDQLYEYYTLYTLTSIRYSIDRADPEVQAEYNFFIDTLQRVQDASDSLYTVVAQGPNVETLERMYYGRGFFDDYDTDSGDRNSRLSALLAQESRLNAQYEQLCLGQTITYRGEERSWDELAADPNLTGRRWREACAAYYEKYNPLLGEVFVELLKVRHEIAQVAGYDSYADYAYDGFGREYDQDQARKYLEDIWELLLPVYQAAEEEDLWSVYAMNSPMGEKDLRAALYQCLEEIGQGLPDIWEFMETYELSDLTGSPNKSSGAFEIYISAYEAPFLVANLDGTEGDILTVAHEFGHFCDDYFNWGVTYNMDVAECCSQGLEYLLLEYLDGPCSSEQAENLLGAKLLDTLDLYIWQGLYSVFEDVIYRMDPEDITVEDVNEVYTRVCQRFGMEDDGGAGFYSLSWVDISHFYSQPFYIISYPVSNDIAMQLWILEQEEPGEGIRTYLELLDRGENASAGLMDLTELSGLESPFAPGRVESVTRAVSKALDLDVEIRPAA